MTQEQFCTDVKTYRTMIYRLAFGYMGNYFDAEDISQEAFLRLYRYKKTFKDEEHKKAFLLRVTINLCKNLHKSAWFRKRTELDGSIPAEPCPASLREDSEDALREYILKLKPKLRIVVFLYYYEGYSVIETAKLLKISESAVTTRLGRARAELKMQLTDDKEI